MDDEVQLVERLRGGDEQAFVTLVDRYHASMLRLASTFVPNRAVAEEVVQDTWLGVVRGIERFEGRSSLRTWLYRILVNRARTAGVREHRHGESVEGLPIVDPQRFDAHGVWASPPQPWTDDADSRIDAEAVWTRVRTHLNGLPESQRQVVILRDIDGLSSAEVAEMLGVSEGNVRVLLHRGRAKLRGLLERDLGKVGAG